MTVQMATPQLLPLELRFTVYGKAKPGGSKNSWRNPATGRIVTVENSDNVAWREGVAKAGAQAMREAEQPELWDGPLYVEFVFVRPRPQSHYGSGRNAGVLKGSAPAFPTTRPDVLKTARAAEDSLTGQVWTDDSRIVTEVLRKRWGHPERMEVLVRPETDDGSVV